MKKIGIILLILVLLAAAGVYVFRFEIFQVSAEKIIKDNLPSYIFVDKIDFDLEKETMKVSGIGIKNPAGYGDRYLASIDSVLCDYRMKGRSILDGIEITDISAEGVLIKVERLSGGKMNVNEMDTVMSSGGDKGSARGDADKTSSKTSGEKSAGKFDITRLIKLTETVKVRSGKLIFLDEDLPGPSLYRLTIDNITSDITLKLTKDYRGVEMVGSRGTGNINGDLLQSVNWVVSLDPRTPALTMSNRLEPSNVEIKLLEPYYDKYSPVTIERGRFSGTLVFDFDNGNIGSMNTVTLSDLVFRQKTDFRGAMFWDAAIPDIIKYLQSSPGQLTFDFKIKGNMENPKFYPGPVVKAAIQNMAIDKISELIQKPGEGAENAGGEMSDTEKVMSVIKGLMQK